MAGLVRLQVVDEHEGSYLQVGDLAKDVGKAVRALHLYEDMGPPNAAAPPNTHCKGIGSRFHNPATAAITAAGDCGFA